MYRIIGADQKEYGPVSTDVIRQWISEGRLNAQSQLLPEGATEWRLLGSLPEFADALGARTAAAGSPPPLTPQTIGPVPLPGGDYSLDIGQCVTNAWNTLMGNFGLIFGGCLVFGVIQGGIALFCQIPLLGLAFSVGSFVISGPLYAGLYYFILRNLRRQPATIGDIFAGFRIQAGQTILGYLLMILLMAVASLPGAAIMAYPIFQMISHNDVDALNLMIALGGFMVIMIPIIYLSTSWFFVLPLIIDKGLDFGAAMQASRRRVGQHWWLVFGLIVVGGLINCVGCLACCVGTLLSMPLVLCAYMYGYETLFSTPARQSP
jgi:hypothetical protein